MSSSESSSQESSVERKKQRKIPLMEGFALVKPKHKGIVINLSMTKYDVISDVAEELGWRVHYSNKRGDWDVLWTDYMVEPQTLIRMHFFQKISHFPGIHVLARKNLLGLSFMEMSKKFPSAYNFFPRTWMLPTDFPDFRAHVGKTNNQCYIVKPEADCQGRGIFLTFKTDMVENGRHYVVQEYIERPFLVDGLKFDFRVYALLCGTNPMRLYLYEEGLARLATEKYQCPSTKNMKKMYMHLTNYSINKKNPKYIYNSSSKKMDYGHKRSLTSVFAYMERKGYNVRELKRKIQDVVVKTVILGQPLVSHQYKFSQPDDQLRNMCFHILGIDIMVDEDLNPLVIEVNHTPSFATDTPLDYKIKFDLIKDTLTLMNINEKMKKQLLKKTNAYERERITTAKRLVENEERKEKVKEAQLFRDAYEKVNKGKYTKIYPVDNDEQMKIYGEFLKVAEKTYFSENNFIRSQIEKAEGQTTPIKSKTTQSSTSEVIPKVFFRKQTTPSEIVQDKIKNSSAELARKQIKVSSLLQKPLASHGVTLSKKIFKEKYVSSEHQRKGKNLSQFQLEQYITPSTQSVKPSSNNKLNFIRNLPKIEKSLHKFNSPDIQIQKKVTYINFRKKKTIQTQPEQNKIKKVVILGESRQEKIGGYIIPKLMNFQNREEKHHHSRKRTEKDGEGDEKRLGRGFLDF